MTEPTPEATNFSSERDYATFRHARQEAILIFLAWAAALLWSIPYCYFAGFSTQPVTIDPETIPLIAGIPRWVFWGIAFPWLVADIFTIWLCFVYMKDDDLGEAHEGSDVAEDLAEQHSAHPESGSFA